MKISPLQVAKWVGDLFNTGIYHIHINLKRIPHLDGESPYQMNRCVCVLACMYVLYMYVVAISVCVCVCACTIVGVYLSVLYVPVHGQ